MGKFLILIAALVACVAADSSRINGPECGRRLQDLNPKKVHKIVGGQDAAIGDWGWQVSMNISGRFGCGGSLINNEWIITAAHCVGSSSPSRYSFDIGHHDRAVMEPWAQSRRPTGVFRNTQYTSSNYRNDIAMMKIPRVEYADEIVPVCIPNGQVEYAGRPLVVQHTDADPSSDLFDDAGNNAQPGGNRWYLTGITSWGYGCGGGGVYARTSAFYAWIKNTIRAN